MLIYTAPMNMKVYRFLVGKSDRKTQPWEIFNTAETKPVFVSKRYAYTCSYKLFRLRKYTILQKEFQTPEPVVHTCHLIR